MRRRWRQRESTQADAASFILRLRAQSIDEESRSVEAVIATEDIVPVGDFARQRVIDEVLLSSGAEFNDQVSLLDGHVRSLDAVLGSVRDMRVEGNTIVGRLFFGTHERAQHAWQLVRDGHVTNVSAGYEPLDGVEIRPGQTRSVNGRSYTARRRAMQVVTRFRIREVSLLPVGADTATRIRGSVSTMNERLRAYLVDQGLESNSTDAEAWAFFGALDGAARQRATVLMLERSAPESPSVIEDEPEEEPEEEATGDPMDGRIRETSTTVAQRVLADERTRVREITSLARNDVPAELRERAISEGWDIARASREFLGAVRERRQEPARDPGFAIHTRDHERDCTSAALAANLQMRMGLNLIDPNASNERRREQERLMGAAERYRSFDFRDYAENICRLSGVQLPHSREDRIRAAVSGSEFDNIFTTSINARLIATYGEAPDTTRPWTREVDVPNFKTNDRIQLGKSANLKKLGRGGGEAAHTSRDETMESYKIARYANQFSADEQDLIDDDMGAILDFPNEMGRAAARLRPDLVYSILLANAALSDDVALFHSTHGNLDTSAALVAATLKAAITALETQTQNGVPLDLFAAYLLVPKGLKFTAMQLINSSEVRNTGDDSNDVEYGTNNPLFNTLSLISDSRLDAGVTDPTDAEGGTTYSGSADTWYLTAQGGRHTIEVGYRAGTGRRPMVRRYVLDKGSWGLGWDINLDIGAKALDFRGLHKATA